MGAVAWGFMASVTERVARRASEADGDMITPSCSAESTPGGRLETEASGAGVEWVTSGAEAVRGGTVGRGEGWAGSLASFVGTLARAV